MFGETVSFSKMIGIVVIGIGAYLVFHQ